MLELNSDEAVLMLKKYVDERTPLAAAYFDERNKFLLSGRLDSLTPAGLVIRSEAGDFAVIDVRGAVRFELGDRRDLPEQLAHLAGHYSSCLSMLLASGGILSLFEAALEHHED